MGVHRVTEEDQIGFLQGGAHGGKVFLIAFDPLTHRQKDEGVLRVKGLQIKGRLDRGAVFPLGAAI